MDASTNTQRHWEILRIIEFGLQHKDDRLKAYARRLATKYREAGDPKFADCILDAIGDITVAHATMDA